MLVLGRHYVSELKAAGYTASEMRQAYTASGSPKNDDLAFELHAAGCSLTELLDAGFTVVELREAGFGESLPNQDY